MRHETQIETLKTLLELREQGRDQEMLGKVVQIPVRNYTDPDILKREMMTMFHNYPMVAGHASHLRNPGSYLLSDWNKIPNVVVRDREGVLRAFLNTCRHRGTKFVSGDQKQLKALVCPFHGRVYDQIGRASCRERV